ncbi:MAG: S8 family serine peptidase [Bacteroidota bacterium]
MIYAIQQFFSRKTISVKAIALVIILSALQAKTLNAQVAGVDFPGKNEPKLKWGGKLPVSFKESYSRALKAGAPLFNNYYYLLLKFSKIPGEPEQKLLEKAGITLLEYVPELAYHARVKAGIEPDLLRAAGISDMYAMPAESRLHSDLNAFAKSASAHSVIKVSLIVNGSISEKEAQNYVSLAGGTVFKNNFPKLNIEIKAADVIKLASYPFWSWVEPYEGEAVPLNLTTANQSRANVLNANFSGARNLNGAGVMAGVGDGGYVGPHPDFQGRIINTNPSAIPSFTDHGDHVSGTVGGGGVLAPEEKGMAPACSIVTAQASDIVYNAASLVSLYHMVVTNNSYGVSISCASSGDYNSTSTFIDAQLRSNPTLLHCFAASNDGANTCGSFPQGYSTMSIGYGASKNVIAVGSLDVSDNIAGTSSRGPARDGRVKPEICDMGVNTISTIPVTFYGTKSGTSMATPGITGGLALLVQRYRQLNANADPESALLKALVCNTAEDLGNANVDFIYGFGRVNLRRAVEAMEGGRYFHGSVANGAANTHSITLPAGVTQLKVMICWTDREASASASPALVNNLDLSLKDPSNTSILPWVLNPAAASVALPAVRAVDNLNNIEQVTLSNPAAGNYTINVSGTSVPFGPQSYYIVYEYLSPSVVLTYPFGGEKMNTGSSRRLYWDAIGITTGTYTLAYSTDNGTTWVNISTTIAVTAKFFDWTPPTTLGGKVLIRLVHSGGVYSDVTDSPVTFFGYPAVTSAVCSKTVSISWPAVTGATKYTVLIYRNNRMDSVTTITGLAYTFNNLTDGTPYYISVRPENASAVGLRTVVLTAVPVATTACAITNDIGAASLISPAEVCRQFTSSGLSATTSVSFTVRNYGNNSVSVAGVPVKLRINGGSTQTYSLTGTLASNTLTGTLTFANPADMSAAGNYLVEIWTELSGDNNIKNDTLRLTVKHIANPALTLPVSNTFEAVACTISTAAINAIPGAAAWDYAGSSTNARMRSCFLDDLGGGSGLRTITLDRIASGAAVSNYVTYTANLSNYSGTGSLALDFDYMFHGDVSDAAGKRVWARGSDTQPWVQVYDLWANRATAGTLKSVRKLNILPLLAGQTITSSFQLKFGFEGINYAYNAYINGGTSFDNITLSAPGDDIALTALVSPAKACGAGSTSSVVINITNNTLLTITNVPVFYRVDGGSIIQGNVPTIPGNSTVSYTFPSTVDISANRAYSFSVWAAYASDGYHSNDTLSNITVQSYPSKTFPYIEDFESGNGGWLAYGTKSSWEYGSPQNKMITGSAASGTKCWMTKLSGFYNTNELSYLESPCFDLSAYSSNPFLSFSNIYRTESGYDFTWAEYSTDAGSSWTKLGATTSGGTNWYTNSTAQAWDGGISAYRTATHTLPITGMADKSRVKIRFAFSSDESVVDDGVGIDDVKLFFTPNLSIGSVNTTSPYCGGSNISIAYSATGSFFTGNTFTMQLSNASGSFTNAVNIGSVSSSLSGTISCTLPANTITGSGYRIRVISSSPVISPPDNGADITIVTRPESPAITSNNPAPNTTLTLTADFIANAVYDWTGPNGYTATGQSISRANFLADKAGTYTVTATVNGCTSLVSSKAVVYTPFQFTWTGSVSTDWANTSNWNPGRLPDAFSVVTINAVPANQPVISSAVLVNGISIGSGAKLSLNGPNATLSLTGNISNSGTFNGNGGTLKMSGTTSQSFAGNFNIGNLNIDNAAGVSSGSGTLNVFGLLKLQNGMLNTSNGHLTLRSTETGTAMLDAVETGSGITGNITAERYLPGATIRYYTMGTMLKGQTIASILPFASVRGSYPGVVQSGTNSVWFYDPSNGNSSGYYAPSSISDTLPVGRGFMIRLFADFVLNGKTVSYTGAPKTGAVTLPLAYCNTGCTYVSPNGWNLAANPYACTIDWHLVTKTNAGNHYHVWNSSQYGSYSQGSVIGINGATRYIPSGQGFFVPATGTSASLQFTESTKAADQSPSYLRTAPDINVLRLNTMAQDGYTDESAIKFMDGGTNLYNPQVSAEKRMGDVLNISSLDDAGKMLGIQARPIITGQISIRLSLKAAQQGTYKLNISGLPSFENEPVVWLIDNYTHTINRVSEGFTYSLGIASDSASYRPGRFELKISPGEINGSAALANSALSLSVYPNPGKDVFTLSIPGTGRGNIVGLRLLNSIGQVVLTDTFTGSSRGIDLSARPAGVYCVEATVNGFMLRTKLVKE